jgi:hypothetical protein
MLLKTVSKIDPPFGGGAHQVNSAARRFGLQAQRAVGRALIQTKAAMHAVVDFGKI